MSLLEAVQLVPRERVGAAEHASAPCAAVLLDSRNVVLHTMSTFTVRVRINEVFMDRIVFTGLALDTDYGWFNTNHKISSYSKPRQSYKYPV
jgi:hypothetical protein